MWHEQSRTDAANYVTFNYANVIKGSIGNFLPAVDNDQQNFTPYDYASVMEYPAFSFSRNGGPPLDSIPPGMPLSNSVGYSAADVEGIMRLYGVAPTRSDRHIEPARLASDRGWHARHNADDLQLGAEFARTHWLLPPAYKL